MLDRVPARNGRIGSQLSDDGTVRLIVKNDGLFKNFLRRFTHIPVPEVTTIDLDLYGSFVWGAIDGRKAIGEIGALMKDEFGAEVEPLYERLCWYVKILRNNGFVDLLRQREA